MQSIFARGLSPKREGQSLRLCAWLLRVCPALGRMIAENGWGVTAAASWRLGPRLTPHLPGYVVTMDCLRVNGRAVRLEVSIEAPHPEPIKLVALDPDYCI